MPERLGFSLATQLAAQRFRGRKRAERRLAREIEAGRESPERAGERLGLGSAPRPDGPLIWVHTGSEAEALGIPELVDRLRGERDDVAVLITTARHSPDDLLASRLPPDVIVQFAPYDAGVSAFLRHWHPDVAIWADNVLEPALITAAYRAEIPLFLVDARVPARPGLTWLRGARRALLRMFSHVLAGDLRSADGLRALGAAHGNVEMTGFLQEGSAPLPCSQAERDSLAELLAARPVWLAAGVTREEAALAVEAHRQAMRRAHMLLLVIVPDDPDTGPAIAEALERDGWAVGDRLADDEPESEVEIYVADLPDELGLWYRLSPVSLMGGTLLSRDGLKACNPYEAAALGSAVLFGPRTGVWRESYERLQEAGAARAVGDAAELARAVEGLLAPDRVARMAAAAWEVTTSGAEATDRIVRLTLDALDERGA